MIKNYLLLLIFLCSISYVWSQSENLILNGNLNHINRIKSDLNYSHNNVNPGEYTISYYAEANNPFYVTPPNTKGNFLIADMAEESIGKRIWYSTIKIDTGKTYLFSFRAANIHKAYTNPSVIRITINGKSASRLYPLPNNSNDWILCTAYYINGNLLTEITVAVENLVAVSEGNDMALATFTLSETENPYIENPKSRISIPLKDDSVKLVKSVDSLTKIVAVGNPKKNNPEVIATVKKDSLIKPTKPIQQADLKKRNSLTNTSTKKEIKNNTTPPPAKLKPGDGIRAPKEDLSYEWSIPKTMTLPRKNPPVSTSVVSKKKDISPPVIKEPVVLVQKNVRKKITSVDTSYFSKKTADSPTVKNSFNKPPVVGEKIQLGQIYFEQGTSILTLSSFPQLANFVQYLNRYPTVRIRLEGHTETLGDSTKNMLLSEQRVQYLKQYMVEQGIAADRIEWKGYGSSRPLNSNRIENLRKLNRRVEVVLLSK